MDKREININLNDNTEDSRFSTNIKVEDNTIKAATQTKTDITKKGSTGSQSVVKAIGGNVANTVTGGMSGQLSAMAASMATPVGIAMLALIVAQKAYARYEAINAKLNENDELRLRAGGSTRGTVNQRNVRRRVFGGRIIGGQGTYIRR